MRSLSHVSDWRTDSLNIKNSNVVCFISMIPLERIFDWGGEQMALYLDKDVGELIIITLDK